MACHGPLEYSPLLDTGDIIGSNLVVDCRLEDRKGGVVMAQNNTEIEKRLWDIADELRANSKLKSSEYSVPVLGLIFLRYADHKFAQAEKELVGKATGRRTIGKADYQAQGVMFLPAEARFSKLLKLPEGENIGKAINDAMRAIEAENEDLKDVLPRTYNRLENSTVIELLKLMASVPMDVEGDAFGKIYEYFLGQFALAEGQGGGEFYTPTALVKLIVEIMEPFHGRILDPACGSGGMFVQSARFVERHKRNPSTEISIYGQEKIAETVRLCKMNLAVHGLAGDIRQGNTYYEDLHNAVGKFDFVLANPPFNVDRVDKERIKNDTSHYPLGMPTADNANYLWIQVFYGALCESGRAGFVMHNSAADSETEIRKRLVEENAVDLIIATSANLFYTVNLPCSLWFLDRARRGTPREDYILFVDGRDFYRQIDTAHRGITDKQIAELAGIVRSFRGEPEYGEYEDRPGVCKRVHLSEVKARNYSLNPKIYMDAKKVEPGDLQHTLSISEAIGVRQEEARILLRSLNQGLNMEVPSDRGVLFNLARLLFKKWFLHLEAPGASGTGQKHLPVGWKQVLFRELVSDYGGGGWGKDMPGQGHSELVRIIRGTDIVRANMGELSECPVRYIKPSQLQSRELREGDIIIEVSGGGKEQCTGRTAYVTQELLDSFREPLIAASFCKLIRVNPDRMRPTLVFLSLQHIHTERIMEKYEVQSTGIKNFKFEYFLDHEKMIVPTIQIQDRFDRIVSMIFRLIHVLGVIHQSTNEMVCAIPSDNGRLTGMSNLQIR